jgi:hypothetical protein
MMVGARRRLRGPCLPEPTTPLLSIPIAIDLESLKLTFGPWQPAQALSSVIDRTGSKKSRRPISARRSSIGRPSLAISCSSIRPV